MNPHVYIVTGFGPMIDTICRAFSTKEDAMAFLESEWKDLEKWVGYGIESVVNGSIWRTDEAEHQNIEWQLHVKPVE